MKRILHVTDDPVGSILLSDIVSVFDLSETYKFDTARNVKQALDMRTCFWNYDAIVSDMMLELGDIKDMNAYLEQMGMIINQPIPIDQTLGEMANGQLSPDVIYYNKRFSDRGNGALLFYLARIPTEIGGIGYTGGLMIFSFSDMYEVRGHFEKIML